MDKLYFCTLFESTRAYKTIYLGESTLVWNSISFIDCSRECYGAKLLLCCGETFNEIESLMYGTCLQKSIMKILMLNM